MNFIIGCNYWASNAGIEMWREFNKETINSDLEILSKHGVKFLRVFPLWRDFQPVKPNFGGRGVLFEYVMEDGKFPNNDYYLDEKMLERFAEFLDVCDTYDIKVIVGLITGWMSGGLFIPSAFYGKNILTDRTAIYFEQLFIKGFVERFKDRKAIYAWDLGNECNTAGEIGDRFSAAMWTGVISNAIRTADPNRMVVSGMHGLTLDGNWRISDQARFTDLLTTHPYPLWCRYTTIDETLSFRTTMHATTETKWYSDIGGKPCLAEEIGTMGPMICSDEKSADFLRLNMFSLWANGGSGVMWWCNHDQHQLETFPYITNMVERELGLVAVGNRPKPVLCEMKRFAEFLSSVDIELPKASENGVILLTEGQDHWGIAYMTYVLAKKIGLNLKFSYPFEQKIPDSKLYLMPSINGLCLMHKETFDELKRRVFDGAVLYISAGNAIIQGFEEFIGLKVVDSGDYYQKTSVQLLGEELSVEKQFVRQLQPTTAKIIATDNTNNPFVTVNEYGKGKVYFVNAPIENKLLHTHNAFDGKAEMLYKTIFKDNIGNLKVNVCGENVVFTLNEDDTDTYLVVINHSEKEQEICIDLKNNFIIDKVIYGDKQTIKPYDACIIKLKTQMK